jgi:hypothetical protein
MSSLFQSIRADNPVPVGFRVGVLLPSQDKVMCTGHNAGGDVPSDILVISVTEDSLGEMTHHHFRCGRCAGALVFHMVSVLHRMRSGEISVRDAVNEKMC